MRLIVKPIRYAMVSAISAAVSLTIAVHLGTAWTSAAGLGRLEDRRLASDEAALKAA